MCYLVGMKIETSNIVCSLEENKKAKKKCNIFFLVYENPIVFALSFLSKLFILPRFSAPK